MSISSWPAEKYTRKYSQQVFVLTLWPPANVEVKENGINCEVSGAYKHGKYEKVWKKRLCVMWNVEVFATQKCHPANQPTMTDYTDPWYSCGSKSESHQDIIYLYMCSIMSWISTNISCRLKSANTHFRTMTTLRVMSQTFCTTITCNRVTKYTVTHKGPTWNKPWNVKKKMNRVTKLLIVCLINNGSTFFELHIL